MVVGVGAESEVMPDSVVGELHLGSGCEIAGEQGQNAGGSFIHSLQQGNDSRKEPSLMEVDAVGELPKVGIEESHDVLL